MRMIINRKKSNQIAGRPVTTQRALLLDIIRKTDKHLDADELYRIAKEKEPRISLATIYRNLKLFKELGLIAESSLGDTHSHYESKSKADHHHLVCLGCGKIVEFDSPLLAKAAAIIKKEKRFDITSIQLRMEGYCSDCKQKRK
jgi:Fur family ferric uptake transcriptional regulator